MTTIIFPGQGSQAKGMGGSLFSEFPDITKKADNILGYSIEKLCLEDTNNQLNSTNFTQPALYVVNALSYLKKLQENGKKPEYVTGHSLGEYSALFAAEVYDFETGLKLVQKRGELMSKATGGGMAAVVGLKSDVIENILNKNNLSTISIANYNSKLQTIISGPKDAIQAAEGLFTKSGAMLYMPLKVSGAFHSSYMNDAQQEYANFLKDFTFNTPKIITIANLDALPYQHDKIASNLTLQINHPVLWTQSIEYLLARGESAFTEVGPGKVLTGLVSKIQKGQ